MTAQRQSWKRTCHVCDKALNIRQESHVTRQGRVAHWACAYPEARRERS